MSLLSRCLVALALCVFYRAWGAQLDQAAQPATSAKTTLIKFQHAPFPFKEHVYSTNTAPFFDVQEKGRRGHTARAGVVYWEDQTYSDNRVLISIPPQFNLQQPALIVVYLHGNLATLERDIGDRQQIPQQLAKSGLNAILVAPQFAVDAQDSSAGHFADRDFFDKFLTEAADRIGSWQSNMEYTRQLKNARVVIVAYSGGYQAAAYALRNGGVDTRIKGVILLDALYGNGQAFADFILSNQRLSFFVSSFTESTRPANEQLQATLAKQGLDLNRTLPPQLGPGSFSFIHLQDNVDHKELLTYAWDQDPLADILRRIK